MIAVTFAVQLVLSEDYISSRHVEMCVPASQDSSLFFSVCSLSCVFPPKRTNYLFDVIET